jgi:hypothetical protein
MLDYVKDTLSSHVQLYISDIMVFNCIAIEEFGVPCKNYRPPTRNLTTYIAQRCSEYTSLRFLWSCKCLIYKICSRHDIAEIVLKLVLNTNQSIHQRLTIKLTTLVSID